MKTGINIKVGVTETSFEKKFRNAVLGSDAGKGAGALDRLADQIKTQKDRTRKIRVVNTTNDKEISFAFKSTGYKQYRIDRTVQALKAYLIADGLTTEQALSLLYGTVSRNYQDRYEPLTGATILQIRQERDKLLAEKAGGASAPKVQNAASVKGVKDFLREQGFSVGKELGSGSFGIVNSLKDRDGNSLAVKLFVNKKDRGVIKPDQLSFARSPNMQNNEGIASYLAKSSNAEWKKTEAMVIPTHYVVIAKDQSGRDQMEVIPASEIKARTRAAGGGVLSCVAQLMKKVPGEDVFDAMRREGASRDAFQLNVPGLARSGLETLMQINDRGVLHRDIKPENLRCDGDRLYFIDWGLAYKVHKPRARDNDSEIPEQATNAEATSDLPTGFAGTRGYLHPDMFRKKEPVGSQGDLFAFGMTLLQMSSPLMMRIVGGHMGSKGELYRPKEVPTAASLASMIARSKLGTERDRTALIASLSDPNSPLNLAAKCLELSNTKTPGNSAAQWANRDYSRAKYEELLRHPAVSRSQPSIVEE